MPWLTLQLGRTTFKDSMPSQFKESPVMSACIRAVKASLLNETKDFFHMLQLLDAINLDDHLRGFGKHAPLLWTARKGSTVRALDMLHSRGGETVLLITHFSHNPLSL